MTGAEEPQFDVFFSCPLGSLADGRYQEVWEDANRVVACLEAECGLRAFFLGRDARTRDSLSEMDLPRAKIERAGAALRSARHFLLFYPARLASGALVEAGVALAEGKPCLFAVRNREHLPFMLRHAESVFPVRLLEYKTIDGLVKLLRNRCRDLFGSPLASGAAPQQSAPDAAVRPAAPPGAADDAAALREKFERLRRTVAGLSQDLASLEHLLRVDVPSSLNKTRFIAEKILHRLCTCHGVTWGDAEPTMERMLGPLVSAGCIPRNVSIHLRTIQINSSPGSHYLESALNESHSAIARQALIEFLEWYAALPLPLPLAGAGAGAGAGPAGGAT